MKPINRHTSSDPIKCLPVNISKIEPVCLRQPDWKTLISTYTPKKNKWTPTWRTSSFQTWSWDVSYSLQCSKSNNEPYKCKPSPISPEIGGLWILQRWTFTVEGQPHYLNNTQFGSENWGQPNVDPEWKTMFVQSSAELGGKLLSTPNVGGKFLACHRKSMGDGSLWFIMHQFSGNLAGSAPLWAPRGWPSRRTHGAANDYLTIWEFCWYITQESPTIQSKPTMSQ